MTWNPFDRELNDEYRARALRAREAGGSTVRVYRSQVAMDNASGGNVGPGTWAHCLAAARAGWESAKAEAHSQFDWDARLREEMGGCDEIPF